MTPDAPTPFASRNPAMVDTFAMWTALSAPLPTMGSLSDGSLAPTVKAPTRKKCLHSPLTVARLPDPIPHYSVVEDRYPPNQAWTDPGVGAIDRPVREL